MAEFCKNCGAVKRTKYVKVLGGASANSHSGTIRGYHEQRSWCPRCEREPPATVREPAKAQ